MRRRTGLMLLAAVAAAVFPMTGCATKAAADAPVVTYYYVPG